VGQRPGAGARSVDSAEPGALLRSIYSSAVLDRLVASSPVVRVQLPRDDRERVVPLTVAQVQALADAMRRAAGDGAHPGRARAADRRAAGAARPGRRLPAADGPGEFQIAPRTKVRTEPKTPRSRRTVPLPQVVADALAAHIAEFPPGADGSLFTSPTRRRVLAASTTGRVFTAAVKRAGLPAGTTSHDLRHHYASVLLAAGESVVAVAERLGHENATLVLKTYGHLMPDSEDRTRRAVDEAWCAITVPSEQSAER
jgi:integrase